MIIATLNLMSALACLFIAVRLIMFKKGSKRYRFLISLAAWVIINASVSVAIWLLIAGFKSLLLALPVTVFLYVFAIQLFFCRGNLAALFYKTLLARQS